MFDEKYDHPAIVAIHLTMTCRGNFEQEKFREAMKPWCEKYGANKPGKVGLSRTLGRAFKDLSDKGIQHDQSGRGAAAIHTLSSKNLSALEDEDQVGDSLGSTEVKARIIIDPDKQDAFSIKFTPEDHPLCPEIRAAFDRHCGLYNATYDIKPWLCHQALAEIGAISSPDAPGKYILPCRELKPGITTATAITELMEALDSVSSRDNKVTLYPLGFIPSEDSSAQVDLAMDAILDELEKERKDFDKFLAEPGGKRAIATKIAKAAALRERLLSLGESLGLGLEDVEKSLTEIETRLGFAEMAAEVQES